MEDFHILKQCWSRMLSAVSSSVADGRGIKEEELGLEKDVMSFSTPSDLVA